MPKDGRRILKNKSTDGDGVEREVWIELIDDDVVIDYWRHYKNLDQPYYSQMTLGRSSAVALGLNLIAVICGASNSHLEVMLSVLDADWESKDTDDSSEDSEDMHSPDKIEDKSE